MPILVCTVTQQMGARWLSVRNGVTIHQQFSTRNSLYQLVYIVSSILLDQLAFQVSLVETLSIRFFITCGGVPRGFLSTNHRPTHDRHLMPTSVATPRNYHAILVNH